MTKISVFVIKDTVSLKEWKPKGTWSRLKKGLDEGYGGVKEAIKEAYAIVTATIDESFTKESTFGLHHEVTADGQVVLNKFALAKAVADLSTNTTLTEEQKAEARAHLLKHYEELEEEPPASLIEGEMSILDAMIGGMKPEDIPLAPGVDVEAIKAGDDDPLEVVVSVPASKSKRGWYYTGESLQDIVNFVNDETLSGFLGHQKAEDVDTQFPTPVTHWVGALWKDGKAYFRGVVDKAAPDLKRWIRSKRVTQVSIFGIPTLKNVNGEVHVVGYKPLSIDWTPLHRAGMPSSIVAFGEMDTLTIKPFDDSMAGTDGSYEALREAVVGAVRNKFGKDDNYTWVDRLYVDYVIVSVESKNGPRELYKVSYSIADGRVVLGKDAEKVVEKITFVPSGEMEVIADTSSAPLPFDGSHEGLREALLAAVRNKYQHDGNYIWIRRVYDDYVIVQYEAKDSPAKLFKLAYGLSGNKILLGDEGKQVIEHTIYVPSGEMSTKGDESMTIQEMLAAVRSALAKKETDLVTVLGEMGYEKDAVVTQLAGEQMEQFKTGAEFGAKLATTLGFAKETPADEALALAGEMAEVWKALGYDKDKPEKPAEVVGEMANTMQQQAKETHAKLVEETIKEKVTGEQAQILVTKMLNVAEGATKEEISGEIDGLLADEALKNILGKSFVEQPAVTGAGGSEAPKHLVQRTASI